MIFIFLFVLDRLFKILALFFVQDFKILDNLFKFSLATNHGLAFSIPFPGKFLLCLYLLIFTELIIYGFQLEKQHSQQKLKKISLLLIFTGAFSNFLDRLFLGYVIDYFSILNLNIFNLADLMIIAGVAGFLFSLRRQTFTIER